MIYYKNNKKIIDEKNIASVIKKKKIKNIILCHGVFDIVHPGHIRHLNYCKKKAKNLIVSITSDKFIKKGTYRPLVPEKIRAFNLSVLDFVDYVVINNSPEPYSLIKKIKPLFFAKGYEYKNFNKKTSLEKKLVEKYKGKIIFTPGDYILSSSKIIDNYKLDLSLEKLKYLMDSEKSSFSKLRSIVKKSHNLKVTIIGDTILDEKIDCEAIDGMHKTPTLSLVEKNMEKSTGGAAVVAKHFAQIVKKVNLISIIGNDYAGKYIKNDLKKNKISFSFFKENNRDTTIKKSYWANNHKLIKINKVKNESVDNEILEKICNQIKKNKDSDIFVLSDFRHGIFNKFNNDIIFKSINKKKFKVADSQIASRWGNITEFKNFDFIAPTEKEARISLMEQDIPVRPLSDLLLKKTNANNLILKLGPNGLIALDKKRQAYIVLDSFADNIIDSTGAGDALLAYSTISLYLTNSLTIASILGNIAAACACETSNNEQVTKKMMIDKINSLEKNLDF